MAASTDLCTLADVKAYLGISGSTYDGVLGTLIDAASEAIENYCRRRFSETEHTEYHDGWGSTQIVLDHHPIASVSALYDDLNRDFDSETLIESDDYAFYPEEGILELLQGIFQTGVRNIKAVYTAGYATVPTDVAQAARILVASWFNRGRQGGDGISQETLGQYAAHYANDPLPVQVLSLLAPYRNVRV